ncbi:c-type cytochrome [Taylorella equigenitalis]|uniref:c-type cytochrome n=1 Tax=Taylorella equigenitalis TaxID=29575 RepID=UPI00237E35AD|nr:cytochrome c [Taylorella equigenitalis]WDU52338.1 cytochrome c [Taylorella equigenitalis]
MKLLKTIFVATCMISAVAVQAHDKAEPTPAEKAVKYRQSAKTVMATHFGILGGLLKAEKFDEEVTEKQAEIIAVVARLPWSHFGPGTEGGNAKPEVWTNVAKFEENRDLLLKSVDDLEDAEELEEFKKAFAGMGDACKKCHTEFRVKK